MSPSWSLLWALGFYPAASPLRPVQTVYQEVEEGCIHIRSPFLCWAVFAPWGVNFDALGGLHTFIGIVPQESLPALGQKPSADTEKFVATHR